MFLVFTELNLATRMTGGALSLPSTPLATSFQRNMVKKSCDCHWQSLPSEKETSKELLMFRQRTELKKLINEVTSMVQKK